MTNLEEKVKRCHEACPCQNVITRHCRRENKNEGGLRCLCNRNYTKDKKQNCMWPGHTAIDELAASVGGHTAACIADEDAGCTCGYSARYGPASTESRARGVDAEKVREAITMLRLRNFRLDEVSTFLDTVSSLLESALAESESMTKRKEGRAK